MSLGGVEHVEPQEEVEREFTEAGSEKKTLSLTCSPDFSEESILKYLAAFKNQAKPL